MRNLMLFLLVSFLVGIVWSRNQRKLPTALGDSQKVLAREASLHRLDILGHDGRSKMLFATGDSGNVGLWMFDSANRGEFALNVHANGFPAVIVSDRAIRNFGLGRQDGRNATPILVFRNKDVVRMVMGLSMTEPHEPPFLVEWGKDGKQHNVIGQYCTKPSRVCTD